MATTEQLRDSLRETGFRGELRAEEFLGPYTTWRIGGPAELLASPADRNDLVRAVNWAAARGLRWRVLGNGSNLLIADEGVRGLVLRVRRVLDEVHEIDGGLRVGAGAMLAAVANLAASRGLVGLEFAAGIPGTVGGAIVMNAGWHENEIGGVVGCVDYLQEDGNVVRHPRQACEFRYRSSRFLGGRGVVLAAEFRLDSGDPDEIAARLERYADSRKANQPTELPSCGSVFLKPEGDYAGRLIEQAGLKGLRVGDAEVSTKHANFFVNVGRATARDVLTLVERVERKVEQQFGVRLTREFEYWS
jgi:UDP-N-acetylmuramate dehydrogenase